MEDISNFVAFLIVTLAVAIILILLAKDNRGKDPNVSIVDFSFQPASLNIEVGSVVTWTNDENTAHTVTSDGGTFGSGTLQPHYRFSHTFSEPGVFDYHCRIHPEMRGRIIAS